MKAFKNSVIFLLLLVSQSPVSALELTIYSTALPGAITPELYRPSPNTGANESLPGYAYIRDQRDIDLKAGHNTISFQGISAYLDPTTVQFQSQTDPNGTEVLNQSYRFDLANNQTLLNNAIGKEITVEENHGTDITTLTGTLLNTNGGLMLQDKTGQIISLNHYTRIQFPAASNTMFNKPTLLWDIMATKQAKHKTETRYQTSEMTWWADYSATFTADLDPNKGSLELNSWVSVMNRTGMNFEKATLNLVAGDVNKIQTPHYMGRGNMLAAAKMSDSESAGGFNESTLFEYHLYRLQGEIDLPNNSAKQIKFLPKMVKIPVEKQYIYRAMPGMFFSGHVNTDKNFNTNAQSKIEVYLKWKNEQKSGLGIALPAGRVRISEQDPTRNTLEFIGEDFFQHTANNEDIIIKIGNAFDIRAKRTQLDFTVDNNRHIMEESFEITLKNEKDKDVKIIAEETLSRSANWEILKDPTPFKKINANTIQFPMLVKKNSEEKIHYTVRYTW